MSKGELKGIQDKNSLAYFWLTNFSLLYATDEKLANQKIRNTFLILDTL